MRIIAISDTHELHEHIVLPEGDVLVHAGDFTGKGSIGAIGKFMEWFSKQNFKRKLLIGGNHELGLDNGPMRDTKLSIIKNYKNVDYLENSDATIDGIKFWGSPVTPWFYDWAWNVTRGAEIKKVWDLIPDDTNVLITHGPPKNILDVVEDSWGNLEHVGCEDLSYRINYLKELKVHIFGHLHLGYGDSGPINGIRFVNASICSESYRPTNKPITIDI
jgi:Icc-related predicted phosphoesterase